MPLTSKNEYALTGHFRHGPCGSICAQPGACCFMCLCPNCAVGMQRRRILELTGEPYVCCGGIWTCCGFEKPREKWCVHLESFCMPYMALSANHFLVQTRLNKRNSSLDTCCKIGNMCVSLQCCCLRKCCCCDCSEERENLVKAVTCTCVCAHCQDADAIEEFTSGSLKYQGPPSAIIAEFPQHFANIGRGPAPAPVQMQPM